MEIKIEKGIAKGVVKAPPSKSYAHRYLIAGALSGNCQISNISFSDDILATFNCLKALGYKLEKEGNVVTCKGRGSSTRILDCGESGSTLRLKPSTDNIIETIKNHIFKFWINSMKFFSSRF